MRAHEPTITFAGVVKKMTDLAMLVEASEIELPNGDDSIWIPLSCTKGYYEESPEHNPVVVIVTVYQWWGAKRGLCEAPERRYR